MSVPDLGRLPDAALPDHVRAQTYRADAPPVFFGHYWLTCTPALQASNALCLDYSAGKGGPLVTYAYEPDAGPLSLDQVRVHPAA